MLTNLAHKRILLGITGGIAAYKILELIRRLKEQQAQIKVILTSSAKEFITPLSVQALLGERIYDTLLSAENEAAMSHIELARWAEVILVAPATAHFMAKYANGLADDLLSTVALATMAQVIVAPAMNQQMWQHPATQNNLNTLQQRGAIICGPATGSQACGENGPGRMLEAEDLLNALATHFMTKTLAGKHILITAGPTQEPLDPIRFLSNHSSGKMGYALANAALQLGAKVTLISGPTAMKLQHANLTVVNIITAQQMLQAVLDKIDNSLVKTDVFISCAAVADYTPIQTSLQKIKKSTGNISIELQPTEDILGTIAKLPSNKRPFCVGFAAETENLISNAKLKLQQKSLDLVIANSVDNGKGFNQDDNQVVLLHKDGTTKELPTMRKEHLAFTLLEEIL